MIKIAGIDHLVLRTENLPQMLAFYTDVLGCTVERETPPEVGLTQLRAGNALIDLVTVNSRLGKMGGGPPTRANNNMDHFCLQIHPLPEADIKAHLAAFGIKAGDFESRYGAQGHGNSIYLYDPDGNMVELRNQQ